MSNSINTSDPYLYLNTYINKNNATSQNPVIDSEDTSNTDSLISGVSGDSIQISPYALNSSQGSTANDLFSSVLDSLVSNGTITQDQESSITSAFTSARNSFPTYSNNSNTGSQSPLNKLVSNGTITKDQESSIKDALLSARKSSHHHSHRLNKQSELENSTSSTSTDINDTSNLNQN